jgi:hypothetical protein
MGGFCTQNWGIFTQLQRSLGRPENLICICSH